MQIHLFILSTALPLVGPVCGSKLYKAGALAEAINLFQRHKNPQPPRRIHHPPFDKNAANKNAAAKTTPSAIKRTFTLAEVTRSIDDDDE